MASAIMAASAYMVIESNYRKGWVRSILYTIEGSSVLIDDFIVSEVEIIYGVKVVKIYPKKVEFEKNGKSWT